MYEYQVKVKKIIDGDTVVVDIDLGFNCWLRSQYVRLDGIDAPEVKSRDETIKAAGQLTKAKLSQLIEEAKAVILKSSDYEADQDKYGRILGVLYSSTGLNMNEYLVNNSYAVSYHGQNKNEIINAHRVNIDYLLSKGEIVLPVKEAT